MRLAWLLMLGAACTSPSDETPAETDDTDRDSEPVTIDTGDDTDVVEDTDVSRCGTGDPVTVTATVDRGWSVQDADVRWFLEDGRTGLCDAVDTSIAWDQWTCDAPLDGDLWVTVTHPFLRGYAEVVPAGVDGCRDGGEFLDGSFTMTPTGAHFPESRVYAFRRYEDDYTCEHSFELYGQGCYSQAFFCADGHSLVLHTDIMNDGTYMLDVDGTLFNHLFLEGDIPQDTTWTLVDGDTFRAWDGTLWVRRDDFEPWGCLDWEPPPFYDTGILDTGLTLDTDADSDTDSAL